MEFPASNDLQASEVSPRRSSPWAWKSCVPKVSTAIQDGVWRLKWLEIGWLSLEIR